MGQGIIGNKIETSSLAEIAVKSTDPPLSTKHTPPFRKFGELFKKKQGGRQTYLITVLEPFREEISVETEIFTELEDAFNSRTEGIIIDNVFADSEKEQRWVFQSSVAHQRNSLLIRPFQSDDTHMFMNLLCEAHFAHVASGLGCPHLHTISDSYTVNTNIDTIEEPSSLVLVMERVETNLNQIIHYRREHKWDWGEEEFQRFVYDLVDGLSAMHGASISHNDIRPDNIYFTSKRNAYVIGSYASCFKGDSDKQERPLFEGDIYSLGVTLLGAFYLTFPIQVSKVKHQNVKYVSKNPILTILESMIAPSGQRPTIMEVKARLKKVEVEYENMGGMIESMKHLLRPTSAEVAQAKLAVGWAYQRLGLWNEWKNEYEQAYEMTQHDCSTPQRADSLKQLALIDYCRGDFEASSNNAKAAAGLYRKLGQQQREAGNLALAENFYEKAVGCSKFYEFENDVDMARSLSGLARVQLERGQFKKARPIAANASDVAAKFEGKNSIQWCRLRIHQARIDVELGDFESADRILDDCARLIEKKQSINRTATDLLKAELLAQRGFLMMRKSIRCRNDNERETTLRKGERNLIESIKVYQTIEEDHHRELARIATTLGQVQLQRENYQNARLDFDKALDLLSFVETSERVQLRQKGDLYLLRGDASSYCDEPQEAIDDYKKGLTAYKRLYGSDHNRPQALGMGRLGDLYVRLGDAAKARECYKISQHILMNLAGQQDPQFVKYRDRDQALRTQIQA